MGFVHAKKKLSTENPLSYPAFWQAPEVDQYRSERLGEARHDQLSKKEIISKSFH